MYYILWETNGGERKWELISGEDAMQQFVFDLCDSENLTAEEIKVFPADSEMK